MNEIKEYKHIYEEYKSWVDRQLTGLMSDWVLSGHQLRTCAVGRTEIWPIYETSLVRTHLGHNWLSNICLIYDLKQYWIIIIGIWSAGKVWFSLWVFYSFETHRKLCFNEEVIINEDIKRSIAENEVKLIDKKLWL